MFNQLTNLFPKVSTNLLILGVILLAVSTLIAIMMTYYVYKFVTAKSKAKIIGKNLLFVLVGMYIVQLALAISVIAIYSNADEIFTTESSALGTIVALIAVGFVFLIATVVLLWFALPKFGIAFDEKQISFMGESIGYSKITKVIDDETKGAVYINYLQGKRTNKRQKISKSSMFGPFVIKNIELTGHKIEKGNADEYFKNMAALAKKAEIEKEKEIVKKIKNKDDQK
ncbi:hypothetical protein [[Acholeplasma] multilocale]|uniref:hypothetical protein n=1 Tax=[Acholeplasma] multilocale TaxID=264638 RepID=UPI00047B0DED|nr:hypothetical protein [[Acholeplasma] multilocale]